MEDDYGWDDIAENYFEEDEPMTDEEEAAASWAFIRQQELEAFGEFLDAPFCFD